MKRYGAESYGEETVREFANLTKADRLRVGKELFNTLDETLHGFTTQVLNNRGTLQGQVQGYGRTLQFPPDAALKLEEARAGYRTAMGAMNEWRDNTLASTLDGMGVFRRGSAWDLPQRVARWFTAGERDATQVGNAMQILRYADPGLADNIAAYMLEGAIKAGQGTAHAVSSPSGFDLKAFYKNLPKQDILEAVYQGAPGAQGIRGAVLRKDLQELGTIMATLGREQRPVLGESIMTIADRIIKSNPLNPLNWSKLFVPNFIAQQFTNPATRDHLKAILTAQVYPNSVPIPRLAKALQVMEPYIRGGQVATLGGLEQQ